MLKTLRKKGFAKKILWIIAIIIIISFGFFGTGYLLNDLGRTNYAGEAFGRKISFDDFEKIYQQTRIQSIIRYGENFNKISSFINLDTETWDHIILLSEAEKRNIKVGDQEVIEAIEKYPFFQRDGQFDTLLYNDIIKYVFRVKSRDFEEGIRGILKINKLYKQESANLVVAEDEILEFFRKQNEKLQVSYVFISPEQFKSAAVFDPVKAENYYHAHKEEFIQPPSINVDYLSVDFPDNAPETDKETLRQNAQNIYQSLQENNAGWQEVALNHDLEINSTGFFSMDQPNLSLGWSYEILSKIFSLEINQISEPFETPAGIRIVKITEKKDAVIPEYDQIKDKVKDAILLMEGRKIAREKAAEYSKLIKAEYEISKIQDFSKATKALNLEIFQTPVFARGQYLPKIGISREFQEAAFQLSDQKKLSDVVETDNGFCILHLDSYVPADMEQYEKEKEQIAETLSTEKGAEAFTEFLTKLRLKAKLIDNVSKIKNQSQPQ